MATRQTTHLAVSMPDLFPVTEYDKYRDQGTRMLLDASAVDWVEFQSSVEVATWRYRAFHENAEAYKNHYQDLSSIENAFMTERFLFGTFVNAVSSIECLSYSGWALLSTPEVLNISFTEAEKRRCSPASFLDRLCAVDNSDGLRLAVQNIHQSSFWKTCIGLRNRMSHRSKIPRHLSIGEGAPPSTLAGTSSTNAIHVDHIYIDNLIKWLSDSIAEFCDGACSLLSSVEIRSSSADST